jgi:hypothetical protein
MAARNTRTEWLKYNKSIKDKRANKHTVKDKSQRKFQGNSLTIQHLTADVSGRAQKYARIAPREFVPIASSEEATLENIKTACEQYFAPQISSNVKCDILAGERGPSCKTVDQIPDLKIIHVRFVGKATYEDIVDSDRSDQEEGNQPNSSSNNTKTTEEIKNKIPRLDGSPSKYPLSLSVVDMIKLGKIQKKNSCTLVKIYHFDLASNTWNQVPTAVEFLPYDGNEPCGEGRFRRVYKVKSMHPEMGS